MSADEATLARLLALSQQGDKAAYRALLQAARAWLERYFGRRMPPHQRDDLVQETLLSMHRKLATCDPARPFLPWLAAIARYRFVDQLRRQYHAAEVSIEDDLAGASDEPSMHARMSIERLLALLPAGQAAAIELVKIDGLSVADAARLTGQSESLVKINIHRGIRRLAALIEKA